MFQIDICGLACIGAESWENPIGLEALFVSAQHVSGPLGAKNFYCPHRAVLTFWTAPERTCVNDPTDNEYFEGADSWYFDGIDYETPNAKTPPSLTIAQVQTPGLGTLAVLDLQGKRVVFGGLRPALAPGADLGNALALHQLVDHCRVDEDWRRAIPDRDRLLGCRVSLPDNCLVKATASSGPFLLEPIGRAAESGTYSIPGTLRVSARTQSTSVSVLAIDYGQRSVERITLASFAKVAIGTLCGPELREPLPPNEAKKKNDFGAVYALAKDGVDFEDRVVPLRPGVALGKPWCPPSVGLWG